jgi:large subunit ribosomal protein L31
MKESIHPQWFAEARVICACGNTWITGATVPEIRTDICSACHPFYTGEQRIVDTEGQVDRFKKRLQVREQRIADAEARIAAKTPLNLPLSEMNLNARQIAALAERGIVTVGDFLAQLQQGAEEQLLEIPGIGRKALSDLKKGLRARGYDVPKAAETAEAAE